jgi:hemerythrin
MWESGFAGLDDHWSLHLAFATELARRKAEHARSGAKFQVLVEMSHWMDRWLEEHVLGADAEMARFLRERGHAPAYQ